MKKLLLAAVVAAFAASPILAVDAFADDHGNLGKKTEKMKDDAKKMKMDKKEKSEKSVKGMKSKGAEHSSDMAGEKANMKSAVKKY